MQLLKSISKESTKLFTNQNNIAHTSNILTGGKNIEDVTKTYGNVFKH